MLNTTSHVKVQQFGRKLPKHRNSQAMPYLLPRTREAKSGIKQMVHVRLSVRLSVLSVYDRGTTYLN